MKLPRDLAGRQVVQALCRDWDYRIVHQQGSHIILETQEPGHHRLAVPELARNFKVELATDPAAIKEVMGFTMHPSSMPVRLTARRLPRPQTLYDGKQRSPMTAAPS